MPHASSVPQAGFQALILCGPGVSLNTLTSSPEEFPKALIPIANRPMMWYPLDWCYRMGITDIHLVAPPSSAGAIESALSRNAHLKSLGSPKPSVLAPADLSQNTGTAAILRLPEVQAAVTGDFVVLPCDIVCELSGESLLESWMIRQAGLGGVGDSIRGSGLSDGEDAARSHLGGESSGRRGGLGVWYQTKGVEDSIKDEETDFIALAPLPNMAVSPAPSSLLPHVSNLAYSTPTDTLNDIVEEKKRVPLRYSLVRKHGRVKILTTHRDAHIYFLPYWVMELVRRNEAFDSLSEDVLGWWAKAGWQDKVAAKLGLPSILGGVDDSNGEENGAGGALNEDPDVVDVASMSTTWTSSLPSQSSKSPTPQYASRVQLSSSKDASEPLASRPRAKVPPILAYVHPANAASSKSTGSSSPSVSQPLIRRVDTVPLLLTISLRLARLASHEDAAVDPNLPQTPFSHKAKIATPPSIAPKSTVTRADCLLDTSVNVAEKCVIKESVIGSGCNIAQGARLTRCLLMEGVTISDRARLDGCVVGRGAIVGEAAVLRDCEVQEKYHVPEKADAKNEKFMAFEGLDGEGDDMLEGDSGGGIEMEVDFKGAQ